LLRCTADTARLFRATAARTAFGPKPASWSFARSSPQLRPIAKKSGSRVEN